MLLLLTLLAANPPPMQTRSITVSGSAQVRVAPDIVQLLMAVETADKSLSKAKSSNDDRMTKVLAAAKKFGVEPKDLQTDRITIEARRDSSYSSNPSQEPDAYVVRRALVVTLHDLKRFEDLLSVLLEAGANRTDGIEFQTSALRKYRDQARVEAMKAAFEKATALSKEAGLKVGKAQSISEGSSGFGMWSAAPRYGGGMQQNSFQAPSPGGEGQEGSAGFAPGQMLVNASVSITYDLE